MAPGTALSVSSLSARFGGLLALNQVSLQVRETEIVSIIGPNGAGKSTLLNGICRLVPTTGDVEVFGRSVARSHPASVPAHGVARTFQDPQLIDGDSVLDNIMVGAHLSLGYGLLDQLFRRPKVRAREDAHAGRAFALLDMVGLAALAHRRVGELAYGPRKTIDILRSMMPEPRLVLLDEPSSGLDHAERHRIQELLVNFRATHRVAMLVVEHHMDLVRSISDRVVALQTGSVLMEGSPGEVLDSEEFRKALVGAHAAPAA